ncbi:carbohydrate ABC transporter permease [Clostridium swellfunianum]|uniref:carbohydrate ABC transporter permease n=1 Tax=Clostridium swellfunianum TaxID=1367462 RepID=UPI00202EE02F|nr:carbohydrate ABC transporter permease [Clostridium swellfunianum]MCM0647306.1 carbohydrate ABC transporter permease [Clostridium swellfunianum]
MSTQEIYKSAENKSIKKSKVKLFKVNGKNVLLHLVLIAIGILFFFPFLWMLSTALKTPQELIVMPPKLLPETPQWSNFIDAVTTIPFMLYLKNSLVVAILTILGALFSSTITAYSFAKLKWPGREIWFTLMLATMMIPMQVILIPMFIMYSKFGWLDSYLPLVLPAYFGGGQAFYIFLLRQFFRGVPNELTESAVVDGANHFLIFRKIMLPLSKPAVLTVGLFTFMSVWNDFFGPLIFISSPEKSTLALGLRAFQSQFGGQYNLMLAASIIVMTPTIIIFLLAQKQFIEGIKFSGIKG